MTAWSLVYEGFEPSQEGLREALCTVGNGYFATRGAAPEACADGVHYPGTYIAGCFDRRTSEVADRSVENESLVNAPNWLPLTFRIDEGPWFALADVEVEEYRQELDLRRGVMIRLVRFRDVAGRRTTLTQRRFVHMRDPHLAGLQSTIRAEDWSGRLEVRSALDGRVANCGVARYRSLDGHHLVPASARETGEDTICVQVETSQSRVRIAEAARTRMLRNSGVVPARRRAVVEEGYAAHDLALDLDAGDEITVEKVVALYTSRDHAISEPGLAACHKLSRVPSFDELADQHAVAWARLWDRCGIAIADGDERSAMVLNLHVFHLLQTVSEHTHDLDVGVPARGLHGEAYRGHIFWDELFILPFLNLRMPEVSKGLLRYRYRRLTAARYAARDAGFEGAMYPWQSGSSGREETQTLHLNPRSGRWLPDHSHLQRHINSAIAYNVWHYYQATDDLDFLVFHGAEMILEIARFWASIATYNRALDRYEIKGVMGPDEYHDGYRDREEPGLDNNAYTNVMAVWVLLRALDVFHLLPEASRQNLVDKIGLGREELERWEEISRKMLVPFHGDRIISQFDGYGDLEELDWLGYQERYGDIHRLDRILEAEDDTPNRYKVSKQADVLMLFYLFSTEDLRELFQRLGYEWDDELIPRNVEYYLQRTSHGSTLSALVHSWVLARTDRKRSWEFFNGALESDVSDVQGGTTPEGIHLGAMAGTVDVVQRCYVGIETRDGVLWLNPQLPEELRRVQLTGAYRRHFGVTVEVEGDRLRVATRPGPAPPIRIGYRGEVVELGPGETRVYELSEAPT
ncbi:MAG: glycoside hydrolase family 65 protein [Acidimicrobiia bacterium]|nr:glycoside hydrolase family 65 protein [Acidimicrobiia bacterium]